MESRKRDDAMGDQRPEAVIASNPSSVSIPKLAAMV